MNCNLCKGLYSSIRWETDTFENIKKKINVFVHEGRVINLGLADDKTPFFIANYQCNECLSYWKLTYPDQAFRGGFERM